MCEGKAKLDPVSLGAKRKKYSASHLVLNSIALAAVFCEQIYKNAFRFYYVYLIPINSDERMQQSELLNKFIFFVHYFYTSYKNKIKILINE